MNRDSLVKHAAYTYWANHELVRCVETLTPEQFDHDFKYSMGTLRVQLAHIAGVEYWWFTYLSTGELDFFTDEDFASLDTIKAKWAKAEKIVSTYVASLTDEELQREVKPPFWKPESKPFKVWEAILQVFNHSTDHRAQSLYMLHQLGAPTFQQDYLFWGHPELVE
ncbi:MAG: DinB family protein [Chloroflexi bacterium]|nr:DinB family protein [Chloroflexota bacterium]